MRISALFLCVCMVGLCHAEYQLSQVTNSSWNAEYPRISRDGSFAVFSSTDDLVGSNPAGLMQYFSVNTDGTGLRQLTFRSDNDSTLRYPAISPDGDKLFYMLEGNYGTPDYYRCRLVFLDLTTMVETLFIDETVQNIHCWTGLEYRFIDNERLLVRSKYDLAGGNADLSMELFELNASSQTIRQITSDTGSTVRYDILLLIDENRAFVESRNEIYVLLNIHDGSEIQLPLSDMSRSISVSSAKVLSNKRYLYFVSDNNFLGHNLGHRSQIYEFDLQQLSLRQITHNMDSYTSIFGLQSPGDTNTLYFLADANIAGLNPQGESDLFSYLPITGAFDRMNITSGNRLYSLRLSPDLEFALFFTRETNSQGTTIWRMNQLNLATRNVQQIVDLEYSQSYIPPWYSTSENSRMIVFHSNEDISGQNPDGSRELFLASYVTPQSVPTPPPQQQSPADDTRQPAPSTDVASNGSGGGGGGCSLAPRPVNDGSLVIMLTLVCLVRWRLHADPARRR